MQLLFIRFERKLNGRLPAKAAFVVGNVNGFNRVSIIDVPAGISRRVDIKSILINVRYQLHVQSIGAYVAVYRDGIVL